MPEVIKYSKFNPTQNMTVLVHSRHDDSEYADIAKYLMREDHVHCEQVGFIETADTTAHQYRLVMSGREFCGNAVMCFVHYLVETMKLTAPAIEMDVSGMSHPVRCDVTPNGDDTYQYQVTMPEVNRITPLTMHLDGQDYAAYQLDYDTYQHIIIPTDDMSASLKRACEDYVQHMDIDTALKTIGIIIYSATLRKQFPMIYVPDIDSVIWERGCGSGTASIGYYLSHCKQEEVDHVDVHQPGGTIQVSVQPDASNSSYGECKIIGNVTTVSTGETYI